MARTHNAIPMAEKCNSPTVDKAQPATTKHVGPRSRLSKGKPNTRITPTVLMGEVAPTISVKAAEQKTRDMLFAPIEIANPSEMGTSFVQNSPVVGTGNGRPDVFCRKRSTAPAAT